MKVYFDAQAFQSLNKIGGIGRYNRDFLSVLFRLYPENHYLLFYNGSYRDHWDQTNEFPETHHRFIRYLPGNDLNPLNQWIQHVSYSIGRPDILHILSPLESQSHAVISCRKSRAKTVITLYDFIPLIFRDLYLTSKLSEKLYMERLKILKNADMILSISEATRKDAINLLNVSPEKVINIGLATSGDYYKIDDLDPDTMLNVKRRHQIDGPFILTVSNLDHRKNLSGLLHAFSILPANLIKEYSLVVVTNSPPEYINTNKDITQVLQRNTKLRIKFLHFISNEDLRILYNICSLFVCASLYEGGGLPVLEAMKCGAPVVASDSSSIPEYMGRIDTLFNPSDVAAIAHSMEKILTNDAFRTEIGEFGYKFSMNFTWENLVRRAMMAYRQVLGEA